MISQISYDDYHFNVMISRSSMLIVHRALLYNCCSLASSFCICKVACICRNWLHSRAMFSHLEFFCISQRLIFTDSKFPIILRWQRFLISNSGNISFEVTERKIILMRRLSLLILRILWGFIFANRPNQRLYRDWISQLS